VNFDGVYYCFIRYIIQPGTLERSGLGNWNRRVAAANLSAWTKSEGDRRTIIIILLCAYGQYYSIRYDTFYSIESIPIPTLTVRNTSRWAAQVTGMRMIYILDVYNIIYVYTIPYNITNKHYSCVRVRWSLFVPKAYVSFPVFGRRRVRAPCASIYLHSRTPPTKRVFLHAYTYITYVRIYVVYLYIYIYRYRV